MAKRPKTVEAELVSDSTALAPMVSPSVALDQQRPQITNPALAYLASLPSSESRRSTLVHLRNLGRLLKCDWQQIPWAAITFAEVQAIISSEADRFNYRKPEKGRLSPAAIYGMRACLRGVFRQAWKLGIIRGDDYEKIKDVKSVRGSRLPAGRMLTDEEQVALFDACARDTSPIGARDSAIFALLFGCGLRRSEVIALKMSSLAAGHTALRLIGKGNKERRAYLDAGTQIALADWLRWRGDEPGALICPVRRAGKKGAKIVIQPITAKVVYKVCRRRALEAGLSPISPHDGARTYITPRLDNGFDLTIVQRLAGHSDVKTRAKCARRSEKIDRAAAQKRRLPYKHKPHQE